MTFQLDHAGIARILKSAEVQAAVKTAADAVAAGVDGTTDVATYITDRAAASVAHVDPDAVARQATEGTLTRAAAAVGLEVQAR